MQWMQLDIDKSEAEINFLWSKFIFQIFNEFSKFLTDIQNKISASKILFCPTQDYKANLSSYRMKCSLNI